MPAKRSRRQPEFGLKIIPLNPASLPIFTDTAPGTSENPQATSNPVTLSWHPQPPEYLSLERDYNMKVYVPATAASTPPQAHPPLIPPLPPPSPSPPPPPPPLPSPTPPPPCLSPPLLSKSEWDSQSQKLWDQFVQWPPH
ncbi:hypothetical protein EV702DRAFT_1199051 [Suillus placidus]|uniref:Uncharacterized protein n=1 Tax=Suillus placidus TaxID=48579 RepID=A0A9P7D1A3_9AGAM|nr:hypothetical protein EV702DRAFT_1199051 [Suillus placidus]